MNSTSTLTAIDWIIIAALLSFSIAVGFVVKDQVNKGGIEGFFTAGRRMRWWFLGTSIVATTFASDTPLVITGWVAEYGIAGNWFWWGSAISAVAMTVFFARKWRASGVVTDAEISELRYGGPAATTLRTVKAFLNSTFVNFVILGWVFAGMTKISEPFMDWRSLLGSPVYDVLESVYPEFLLFHSFDNTLTICLLMLVTLAYSSLGGIRAVIVTDLVQFSLAMLMSIVLSWAAVQHVGGLEATWQQLADLYPASDSAGSDGYLSHEQVSSFIPSFEQGVGSIGIPFSAFILTLGFMWWTNGNVDGSGYIAQRLYTARDGAEAEKGALWYTVANYLLRSWPWVIAGVVALVLYPRVDIGQLAEEFTHCAQDEAACTLEMRQCLDNRYACTIDGYSLLYRVDESVPATDGAASSVEVSVFREDRERAYPALIRDVLPPGLVGLALASLMAAFMSTVSTHINWGASYITNDFYYRLINPRASDQRLTFVSRVSTVAITLLGIYIATFIDNIGAMWELWGGMMAGLGLPHLLRWLWWRANAWTEITGMLVGFSLALANYLVGRTIGFADGQMSVFPASMASHPIHVICWISLLSATMAITVTLLTKPVDDKQLKEFASKVSPMGWWRQYRGERSQQRSLLSSMWYFVIGTLAVYALMFGIGYMLRLEPLIGSMSIVVGGALLYATIRGLSKFDSVHARREA